MTNFTRLDQEVCLLEKSIKITKRKCTALLDLHSLMRTKTITENFGEFTSKTKTWWQTLTKPLTNAIK